MENLASWGAIVAAIGAVGSILGFWTRYSDRITKAETRAQAALDIAQEARKEAHEATEKLALQSAAFGLYREQIAREYIHREVMREVEDRLTTAINGLGSRLDRFTEAALQKH